jgi:hypothetical protein
MRKTEMTEKQLQERTTVIEMLTTAGWTGLLEDDLFERGRLCDPEARMEYQNETVSLEVDYLAETPSIMLSVYGSQGESMNLSIDYEDKLQEILTAIISFQDSISPQNFKEPLRKLLKVCPSTTYIEREDGFVKLIDAESNYDENRNDTSKDR